MPQEAIDTMIAEAKSNDMIGTGKNGGEYITRQNVAFMQQRFAENLDFQETMFKSTVQGLENEATQLKSALNNPENPLKGKDAEAAQERLDLLMAPEGPIAMGYNYLDNKLPELREQEAIAETPQMFTPTAADVAAHKLDPNTQYMGYFDKQGDLRTVLRVATAEDKGEDGGAGVDTGITQRNFDNDAKTTIFTRLGANDFESIKPTAQPKADAMLFRATNIGASEEYGRTGTDVAADVAIEFDQVPAQIKRAKESYTAETDQGKKLRAKFPDPATYDQALRDHIIKLWGRTDAWGRDISEWKPGYVPPKPKGRIQRGKELIFGG